MQMLHRYYTNEVCNHYAYYAVITQINHADFTQINHAIHYADYAIQLRKYDYAIPQNVTTQITQIPFSLLVRIITSDAMGNFKLRASG